MQKIMLITILFHQIYSILVNTKYIVLSRARPCVDLNLLQIVYKLTIETEKTNLFFQFTVNPSTLELPLVLQFIDTNTQLKVANEH